MMAWAILIRRVRQYGVSTILKTISWETMITVATRMILMEDTIRTWKKSRWSMFHLVNQMGNGECTKCHVAGNHLILVDHYESCVHAWMPSALFNTLDQQLLEGETYTIHHFRAKHYPENVRNKCFDNDIFICFTSFTVVTPNQQPQFWIPDNVFDLIPLQNLGQHMSEDSYCIGYVEQLQTVNHFVDYRGTNQSFIKFQINDIIVRVEVTLWGDLANDFFIATAEATVNPVIVIIASCRLFSHQGSLRLSSVDCTRFYVNPDNADAANLRTALDYVE